MAKLTKKELAWIEKVQKVLDECPSERIGFYALGENELHLYNKEGESGYVERSLPSRQYGFVESVCNSDADFGHFIMLPSDIEIG
ncbi:hypothetical protein ACPS97_003714 [Providencia rettgeri]|uniref:hypothetical protein n=1 Tax=Providencia rettgeri TaxID=587 RepID=UPI001B3842CE|nr:hypothetical protein [Providencia rettgeri]ELH9583191.1 hypothetical protein [Providencia rettgeri]EMA4646466.1 hypothetical protein [Providencia rettgeri]MBQ0339645.1 hypothetical protein [Providencia rettgeri]WRR98638.1 hypothetical protein VNI59_07825 [Providencia rettgeri]